jgi:signal transduction histidine kinase
LGELPKVHCVPAQISQVLMNLLLNAAQAIEEQGVIVIRTGSEGGEVWIEIQDDGRGIEPHNKKRIFEPFFTTKPAGKGTGLGLSIAWGIVQRHKGRIEVSSEKGDGTIFRVVLPVDPEAVA